MTGLVAVDGDSTDRVRYGYPASAMVGDYLRSAAGLVPIGVIFATVPVGIVPAIVFGALAAVFGAFAIRTGLRHATIIEVSATGLRAVGVRRTLIAWAALDRLKLAYYSTRRDRGSGWMQLDLGAGRARVRLDSRLDRFDQLVRHAVVAAAARNLALNDATAANLQALGIRLPQGALQ